MIQLKMILIWVEVTCSMFLLLDENSTVLLQHCAALTGKQRNEISQRFVAYEYYVYPRIVE